VLRGRSAQSWISSEEGFLWRGQEVLRIEGFSDAIFAFAVTLLVVSLEVPNTFDELLASMQGFIAFAICFALLLTVWFEQNKFFRRYGLNDTTTMHLNALLLFVVLFYVYPLKFLFTALIDSLLGFSTQLGGSAENVIESIEPGQWPQLLIIFGAGFVVVQLVFVLLYWRAYTLRDTLELNVHEASITRQEIQGFLILTAIGVASIAIAILGGEEETSWAGWVYALSWPLMQLHSYIMARRRRNTTTSP
jgi:uncharacterized membrane protein